MRRIATAMVVGAALLVSGNAVAEPRLSHTDYIRCTAHMEQASMKLVLGDFPEADIDAAGLCRARADDTPASLGLDKQQLAQLGKIIALFSSQLGAPTPTVHMKLSDEIATFVDLLD